MAYKNNKKAGDNIDNDIVHDIPGPCFSCRCNENLYYENTTGRPTIHLKCLPTCNKVNIPSPSMELSEAIKGEEFTNDLIAYTYEGQKWFKNMHELMKYLFSTYNDEKKIASILESKKWKIKRK